MIERLKNLWSNYRVLSMILLALFTVCLSVASIMYLLLPNKGQPSTQQKKVQVEKKVPDTKSIPKKDKKGGDEKHSEQPESWIRPLWIVSLLATLGVLTIPTAVWVMFLKTKRRIEPRPPPPSTPQPAQPTTTATKTSDNKSFDWWGWSMKGLWFAVVALVLVFGGLFLYNQWEESRSNMGQSDILYRMRVDSVPVEIAKRVICECESGCRQFEDDGKTPFKNRGVPKRGIPRSDAIGKYQFRALHDEEIKRLKLDPKLYNRETEEGQERYFEYLYAKEGFGPWDHDQQFGGGSACWGPKLIALGYSPDGRGSVKQAKLPLDLGIVEVPENGWSEEKRAPQINGTILSWGRMDLSKGKVCEVRFDRDPKKVFPIAGNYNHLRPTIVEFKCLEPAEVRVTVEKSM